MPGAGGSVPMMSGLTRELPKSGEPLARGVAATERFRLSAYNTLRHGRDYSDPGASLYEERYRRRIITNLERRQSRWGTSHR